MGATCASLSSLGARVASIGGMARKTTSMSAETWFSLPINLQLAPDKAMAQLEAVLHELMAADRPVSLSPAMAGGDLERMRPRQGMRATASVATVRCDCVKCTDDEDGTEAAVLDQRRLRRGSACMSARADDLSGRTVDESDTDNDDDEESDESGRLSDTFVWQHLLEVTRTLVAPRRALRDWHTVHRRVECLERVIAFIVCRMRRANRRLRLLDRRLKRQARLVPLDTDTHAKARNELRRTLELLAMALNHIFSYKCPLYGASFSQGPVRMEEAERDVKWARWWNEQWKPGLPVDYFDAGRDRWIAAIITDVHKSLGCGAVARVDIRYGRAYPWESRLSVPSGLVRPLCSMARPQHSESEIAAALGHRGLDDMATPGRLAQWRRALIVGSKVDAADRFGGWYTATIRAIHTRPSPAGADRKVDGKASPGGADRKVDEKASPGGADRKVDEKAMDGVERDGGWDEILLRFDGWSERHAEWRRRDSPRFVPVGEWRSALAKGDRLDAVDFQHKWFPVNVVAHSRRDVLINYTGWPHKYDVWIGRHSSQLARTGTRAALYDSDLTAQQWYDKDDPEDMFAIARIPIAAANEHDAHIARHRARHGQGADRLPPADWKLLDDRSATGPRATEGADDERRPGVAPGMELMERIQRGQRPLQTPTERAIHLNRQRRHADDIMRDDDVPRATDSTAGVQPFAPQRSTVLSADRNPSLALSGAAATTAGATHPSHPAATARPQAQSAVTASTPQSEFRPNSLWANPFPFVGAAMGVQSSLGGPRVPQQTTIPNVPSLNFPPSRCMRISPNATITFGGVTDPTASAAAGVVPIAGAPQRLAGSITAMNMPGSAGPAYTLAPPPSSTAATGSSPPTRGPVATSTLTMHNRGAADSPPRAFAEREATAVTMNDSGSPPHARGASAVTMNDSGLPPHARGASAVTMNDRGSPPHARGASATTMNDRGAAAAARLAAAASAVETRSAAVDDSCAVDAATHARASIEPGVARSGTDLAANWSGYGVATSNAARDVSGRESPNAHLYTRAIFVSDGTLPLVPAAGTLMARRGRIDARVDEPLVVTAPAPAPAPAAAAAAAAATESMPSWLPPLPPQPLPQVVMAPLATPSLPHRDKGGERDNLHLVQLVNAFGECGGFQAVLHAMNATDSAAALRLHIGTFSRMHRMLTYPFAVAFVPTFVRVSCRNLLRCAADLDHDSVRHVIRQLRRLARRVDPYEKFTDCRRELHAFAVETAFGATCLLGDVRTVIFDYYYQPWWREDIWTCPACTLENSEADPMCHACRSPNPSRGAPQEQVHVPEMGIAMSRVQFEQWLVEQRLTADRPRHAPAPATARMQDANDAHGNNNNDDDDDDNNNNDDDDNEGSENEDNAADDVHSDADAGSDQERAAAAAAAGPIDGNQGPTGGQGVPGPPGRQAPIGPSSAAGATGHQRPVEPPGDDVRARLIQLRLLAMAGFDTTQMALGRTISMSSIAASPEIETVWTCRACTFANDAASEACCLCEADRPPRQVVDHSTTVRSTGAAASAVASGCPSGASPASAAASAPTDGMSAGTAAASAPTGGMAAGTAAASTAAGAAASTVQSMGARTSASSGGGSIPNSMLAASSASGRAPDAACAACTFEFSVAEALCPICDTPRVRI